MEGLHCDAVGWNGILVHNNSAEILQKIEELNASRNIPGADAATIDRQVQELEHELENLQEQATAQIHAPTTPAGPMKTVYTLGDVPVDVNRLPQAVPATQKVISARAYGGTYVQEANPLTMTPQQFHEFVSNNLPGNAFPKRLTVIEVPEGGVEIDPSVPNPPAGTGHIPPNSGARVTSVYEITYDQWGKPTFKKIE